MNIILTGFMGAGKTTAGKLLAARLGFTFIDTDEYILKTTPFTSIAQIFEEKGEPFFRALEATAAAELAAQTNAVIACGGGMQTLPKGTVIFLQNSFETIKKRITNIQTRPLMRDENKARKLYNDRQANYAARANFVLATDALSAEETVEKILNLIKKKNYIIGMPVAHSLSPLIHTAGYRALGLDKIFSFEYKEITPEALADFMKTDFNALSVTMPLKTEIIKYLDSLDPAAKEIGAVNTVLGRKGFNTDWFGVQYALGEANIKGKTIVMFGAGGAARAALHAFKPAKEVIIIKRANNPAPALRRADIIVNATPVGMNNNDCLVREEDLRPGQTVFDMVYKPIQTPLIRLAQKNGLRAVTGDKMLLGQALKQFEIMTGYPAPAAAMQAALEEKLNER